MTRRQAYLRRRLREFATEVRGSNLAFKFPEDLFEQLNDEELPWVREQLEILKLRQRPDKLWEERL